MTESPKGAAERAVVAEVAGPIAPYGGTLVDRVVTGEARTRLLAEAASLPRIEIPSRILADLYLISVGALSPLEGFMSSADYEAVLDRMTLENGLPWSIPVVLPISSEEEASVAPGDRVALVTAEGDVAAIVDVTEIYDRDLERESRQVYGTEDEAHPGVAAIRALGSRYVAGPVSYVYEGDISGFPADNLTPAQTRAAFDEAGWRTVVAFQTRNPIHRAHEYLQKCALEIVEGLLVHPLVGETKSDDIPADIRMECYRTILDLYYPGDRVLLSVLPAAMRYAGPKEAIFHAIIRRNYGCTHFIVGRDHAGVGDYYGTYDAQEIFDEVDTDLLGIVPLKFEHAFWCKRTGQMASNKTTPSSPEERVFLSGTKVREMLSNGERPPAEFTRPEVADVLMKAYRNTE
ncbi:MAG: sulfate adenylyltransferase [Gemmatimonadetes bacterium]|nr:sulfate adenylyltransferase [Gemmatimonadota bacterium]